MNQDFCMSIFTNSSVGAAKSRDNSEPLANSLAAGIDASASINGVGVEKTVEAIESLPVLRCS